ncbi:MAG: signal peptidase II, partial [Bacteroidetes bacterium]|nr:signal peptidase II [Bacteroidota bacterium]
MENNTNNIDDVNILNDNSKDNTIFFFILALFFVLLDQITKFAIKGFSFAGIEHQGLGYGELIPILGNILQLTFIENEGMAFG